MCTCPLETRVIGPLCNARRPVFRVQGKGKHDKKRKGPGRSRDGPKPGSGGGEGGAGAGGEGTGKEPGTWLYSSAADWDSTLFEEYYKLQNIVPDAEWGEFVGTLKRVLPLALRINHLDPLAPVYVRLAARAVCRRV
jgi:hypothetical protein